ncbi:MerR family transcriptional regulator [Candidatus Formimonas warabiya]|uniref:MerR family transcriptional regulator n=2 Tax=Formimonas warabiya TaxID=1761012 RepID=A0A3G1L2S2_FORW1|nr:MerR family transcriptional regulator [Candidatus Formimonas warabiya]ATW28765.1 MerR family transcriptional regulator [Candidatus Formimonas warabiya]
MENRIKIGDFVKLTGSTLKTVLYYHKIGLLQEPERSPGGYRLYGPAELTRMQVIKHVKCLGLDLKRTKEILGDINNHKTLREVLQSLHAELLSEKKSLEERIGKIEDLLSEDTVPLDEDSFVSPSFQMIMEILGTDQIEKYARTCPELFDQHRKVYSILDDFQWGEDYRETFRALAEFFKAHPKEYQISLDYGMRLARLAQLSEDDPEVEALARESAEFIKSMPQLLEILGKQAGIKKPLASLYNGMVAKVVSPAQAKHGQLLQQYLASETDKAGDCEPPALLKDHKR